MSRTKEFKLISIILAMVINQMVHFVFKYKG
jgi:hypothetical protein